MVRWGVYGIARALWRHTTRVAVPGRSTGLVGLDCDHRRLDRARRAAWARRLAKDIPEAGTEGVVDRMVRGRVN